MVQKSENQFLKDYQWGKQWEQKVATTVRRRHPELIGPSRTLAMKGIEWRGQWDDGDMRISIPIQCKRRSLDFTSREDYPFSTIIVDQENKLRSPLIEDREYDLLGMADRLLWVRPFYAYWIGSRDMEHAAIILPTSKPYWRLEQQADRKSGGKIIWNWCCPKDKAIFRPMSEALEFWRWM